MWTLLGFIFWFVLTSFISGYRDMARFWYKGTWGLEMKAKWLPYWTVKKGSKTDPFHSAGGLMWALIFTLLTIESTSYFLQGTIIIISALPLFWLGDVWYLVFLTMLVHGGLMWMCFYWFRNIFMHNLGIASGYRRVNYWWPPPVRWIFKMKT